MKWEDPRKVLARHDARASKRFSQNFLIAREIVDAIAAALLEVEGRTVLEIGPGVGTLSAALLRRGATVVGLERDPAMVAILAKELPSIRVVEGDATQLEVASLVEPPALVAGNLPYAITGPILRRVVDQHRDIERAVLMVQREVAERWSAGPGNKLYGAPTVFLDAVYRVEPVRIVKPTAFFPAPRVTSAVVRLMPHETPRADPTDPRLRDLVKRAFGARRKTLRNAWKGIEGIEEAAETAGVDLKARGETLDVEAFAAVAERL